MRINTLANSPCVLGDVVEDVTVGFPSRYMQIAISIETLLGVALLMIDEMIGQLRSTEEWHIRDSRGNDGQLEEQSNAQRKEHGENSSGSSGDEKKRQGNKKDKQHVNDNHNNSNGGGHSGTPFLEHNKSTFKC
jgi:hypothetical protein